MAALEEKILSKVKKKPVFGGGILTIHFFILGHGEKSLNEFIKNIKSFHPIAKLTAD